MKNLGSAHTFIATLLTGILAIFWLKLCEEARNWGLWSTHTCRKFIHIGTGPFFVFCWLFYPFDSDIAPYCAACVPLLITIQFVLVGLGIIKDPKTVKSISRTGNPTELLRGPMLYGIIFVTSTVLFWAKSPIGISCLMLLCAGDGFADLIGRRYGISKLPWNRSKSWMGSSAFFVSSIVIQIIFILLFSRMGWFFIGIWDYIPTILIVTLVATLVESLPIQEYDNATVFLSALLTTKALGW